MTVADRAAPVYETAEIDVDAGVEAVWETLTDLDSWPQWMAGVKSITASGPFAVGTTFRWKSGPGTIKSEVVAADRTGHAAWTGRTMGIAAVHTWTIEARGTANTHVHTEESWSGSLPRLLRGLLRKTLSRALDDGVRTLKAETERRSG